VAVVNEAMCKGCGSCAGYCPSGAAQIKHFNEPQVFSELEGLLSELRGAGGPAVRIKVEDGARDKMTT
jgi:heterodisulfide reductase subunit A